MLLVKKCQIFLSLDLVKIRLEKMHINFVEKEETFFDYKNKKFESPIDGIFPKGLTHAIGHKMRIFSLFVFGQNKIRNKV